MAREGLIFIDNSNCMRQPPLLSLIAFILLLTVIPAQAQVDKAEATISSIMQEHKVMGLSVAVVKKGKIIYTHSFGLKNAETNTALRDDCLFRIASISKSFSATSIMQLVEAKR